MNSTHFLYLIAHNVRRRGEVPPPLSEELAMNELENNFSGGIWVKRSGTALRLLGAVKSGCSS